MARAPVFEQLESRQLLNGVIQAVVSGHNLTLQGIGLNSDVVVVTQNAAGDITLTPDATTKVKIGNAAPLAAGVANTLGSLVIANLQLVTISLGEGVNNDLTLEGSVLAGKTTPFNILNGVNDVMGAGNNALSLVGVAIGKGGVSLLQRMGNNSLTLASFDPAGGNANIQTTVNGDVDFKYETLGRLLRSVIDVTNSDKVFPTANNEDVIVEGAAITGSLDVTEKGGGVAGNLFAVDGGAASQAGHANVNTVIGATLTYTGGGEYGPGADTVLLGEHILGQDTASGTVSILKNVQLNLGLGDDTVVASTVGSQVGPTFGGSLTIVGGSTGNKTITLDDASIHTNLSVTTGSGNDTFDTGGTTIGLNATIDLGGGKGDDTLNLLAVGDANGPLNSSTTAVGGFTRIVMEGRTEDVNVPNAAAVIKTGSSVLVGGSGVNTVAVTAGATLTSTTSAIVKDHWVGLPLFG